MRKKQAGRVKGFGRLFKRLGGKSYPPDAPIKAAFYLVLTENGQRRTIALKDADGRSITDRAQAEQERDRLTAPARATDEVRRAESITSVVQTAKTREEQARQAISDAEIVLPCAVSWEAFLREKRLAGDEMAPRTEDSYLTYWKQFFGWIAEHHAGIRDLREIRRDHAKAFAEYLTDSGETAKTYNCKTGFLKSFFKTLADPAKMEGNPFETVKPHQKKTKSKRVLSVDELRRLIETAQGEYKTLFIIGTFSGLRLADCALLRWAEIDLERGLIHRTPIKTQRTSGKAVTIGIPAYMRAHLEQITQDQRGGYVCPAIADCYLQDRSRAVSKRIKRIFDAAGIERTRHDEGRAVAANEEGFHSLRHSFVSLMAERGASMSVIQQMVGHTSEQMTRHYLSVTEDAALNAAKLFELTDGTEQAPTRREPLPSWAIDALQAMTARNWKKIQAELLEGGR